MNLDLAIYTPSEAEEITQVSQATVRNWRRAGHLPRHVGHARYDIAEILLQSSMKALVSRGITPEAAKAYSPEVARATFQSLIYSPKAYSKGVADAAMETVAEGAAQRAKDLGGAIGTDVSLELLEQLESQKAMMDAAERRFGLSGMKKPSWLIIWANGDLQFYHDEDISEEAFFGNTVFNEYVRGPVILFCLGAMAQMVLDRLPRAAIRLAEES